MKKFLFIMLSFALALNISAQKTGKKALKQAKKNLGKYNLDPANNQDKLDEAMILLATAFESEEVTSNPESYNVRGQIFNEIANAEIKQLLLNPESKLLNPNAAIDAIDAFSTAIEMAKKKHHTKDAMKGLVETEGHLNNIGITMFQDQKYAESFDNFNAAIKAHELLKNAGKESRLDDKIVKNEHYFYTAAAGYYGKRYEEVLPILEGLKETTDKPLIFEALYNITKESNAEKAVEYLTIGREKFPDDTSLLFAEINHYLQAGKLEELIGKLETAIEKEPDNASVYVTLGNVFDQLSQAETKNGNTEKAQEYFGKALSNYQQTLQIDADNFDATYSIGALYYNQAASLTEEINLYANDFSAEGTKKYNETKAKMDGLFDEALPHFLAAELINGEDMNTLVALREIYARKNDMEKVGEYKTKMGQ